MIVYPVFLGQGKRFFAEERRHDPLSWSARKLACRPAVSSVLSGCRTGSTDRADDAVSLPGRGRQLPKNRPAISRVLNIWRSPRAPLAHDRPGDAFETRVRPQHGAAHRSRLRQWCHGAASHRAGHGHRPAARHHVSRCRTRRDPHAGEPVVRPRLWTRSGACGAFATRARTGCRTATACGFRQTPPRRPTRRSALISRATNATWIGGLPHSWPDQVDARAGGRYDRWLIAKPKRDLPFTLGFYRREDIPFYYALADAFTVVRTRRSARR